MVRMAFAQLAFFCFLAGIESVVKTPLVGPDDVSTVGIGIAVIFGLG